MVTAVAQAGPLLAMWAWAMGLDGVCGRNGAEPERNPFFEMLQGVGIKPDDWDSANTPFRRGKGCDKCAHTGYKGRVGLYELFRMDETLQRLTVERAGSNTLKDHAVKNHGMRTLVGDGKLAVLAGKTTPEEVLRVCQREAL